MATPINGILNEDLQVLWIKSKIHIETDNAFVEARTDKRLVKKGVLPVELRQQAADLRAGLNSLPLKIVYNTPPFA